MYASKQSVAYDYSDYRGNEVKDEKRVVEGTGRHAKAVGLFKTVLLAAAICGACCFIIYNYITLTELSDEYYTMKKSLEKYKNEEIVLTAQKESLYSYNTVENYVQNNLNMLKADKGSVEYVELPSPDKVIRKDSTRGNKGKISYFLNGIKNIAGTVVEYLS